MQGTMDGLFAAMFAAGLASGVHCVAMCGGIVAAFDTVRAIPIQAKIDWRLRLAFNAGRISTYAAAGGIAGTLGAAAYASGVLPAQQTLQIAASVMLILVGLYLAGAGRLLSRFEALGLPLWRRLRPLAARLLPARTPAQSYAAGLVWGWLPCGMVYAALAGAMLAGSALNGALAMAAFGLGTLPFLLAAGWLAARLRAWRVAVGGAVLGFGTYGLAYGFNAAGGLGDTIQRGLLCF